MDGEEPIDGSAAHRRFTEDATARGAANDAAVAPTSAAYQFNPATIPLFDPSNFLTVIAVLFWPLKFFHFVLIPAVFLAGLTMFKHGSEVTSELWGMFGEYSFVIRLLLSLLIVNLVVRLSMGAVVRVFGGAVREFGLTFFLGFIPRFYIDRSAIPHLDRSGQLWAYGAPLLVRLGFFAFGMLAWAAYRSNGTWLPELALLISQAGLWSFLFANVPFLGDGYNWLAVYLRQSMLRQKALIVLSAGLRGRQIPPWIRPGETKLLMLLAIGLILAMVALAASVLIISGLLLFRLQGIGAVIFLGLIGAFAIWLLELKQQLARRRQPRQARLLQAVMASQAARAVEPEAAAPRRTRYLMMWAGGAIALIILAFLPHSYDSAGPFEILPSAGSEVIARTDGEVVDVMVHLGDWVNAGQTLGHLSSTEEQRNVALRREDVARAEARLMQLKENARRLADQDAIEEAQSEVDRLRRALEHDEAQLDRTTIRAPVSGVVMTPNPQFLTGMWLNRGDKFLQIDDTRLVEAEIKIPQGDISLVKPGAKVRLRPWSEGDREIVGQVTDVAPTGLNKVDEIRGSDAPTVDAETSSTATGRAWATAVADEDDSTLVNDVAKARTLRRSAAARHEVARTGLEKTHDGGVVRVKASVVGSGTLLRPGATGYAKISGPEMTAGEAYFRLFVRVFTIELWSWIP